LGDHPCRSSIERESGASDERVKRLVQQKAFLFFTLSTLLHLSVPDGEKPCLPTAAPASNEHKEIVGEHNHGYHQQKVKLLPAVLRINPDAERGIMPLQPGCLEKLARSTHFDQRDHLVPRVLFTLPLVSLPSLALLLFGVCSGWGSCCFS
jgi:hypothetical protein